MLTSDFGIQVKKLNIEVFFLKIVHSCLTSFKSYLFNIKFIFNSILSFLTCALRVQVNMTQWLN